MRVAVRHTDENHPNHGWFAFQEGRIVGFTHPISGESYTPEAVAAALLERAQQVYPQAEGYEHRIETLHVTSLDKAGQEVGAWFPAGESELPRAGHGQTLAHTLKVTQGQEATGGQEAT